MSNYSWVEKYRPDNLDNICSQINTIKSLKSAIVSKNIPHLIFFGPSGCGKTSTILALAKDLFGKEHYRERIVELNASDERGINVIRDKIKTYAKQAIKIINDSPPWKIIILDEADTMTTDSQFALRRIMEQYSKLTRFCIICNYHNKIIDPIISRCSLFRFKSITNNEIIQKLKSICYKENIDFSDLILNKIVTISRGDLRKAINLLQKCYNNDNLNPLKYTEIELILNELSGLIDVKTFNRLMIYIFKKDNKNVEVLINQIFNDGYSIINQILLFHDYIINSNLSSAKKANIVCKIAEIDQNLIKGCDEYIQFMNLVYYIMIIL
jgi:replication factor C subunit 2/4